MGRTRSSRASRMQSSSGSSHSVKQNVVSSTYERDRKRKYRAKKKQESVEVAVRGRKVTIGVKDMSAEEKKEYFKEKMRISRAKKDAKVNDSCSSSSTRDGVHNEAAIGEIVQEVVGDHDVDFVSEGSAVINMLHSSPKKKVTKWRLLEEVRKYLSKFSIEESLDILLVLGHAFDKERKCILEELGIKILDIPNRQKRLNYSELAKSSKHRHRDKLLGMMVSYSPKIVAEAFRTLFFSTEGFSKQDILDSWGFKVNEKFLPCNAIIDISKLDRPTKVKLLAADSSNNKSPSSVSTNYGISRKYSKRVLEESASGKSVDEILTKSKRKSVNQTEWLKIVEDFCLTKPICREAPGETVSIGYGQRTEKYIRQFTVSEIYGLFCLKYTDFPYHLSTFRKLIPKNLVRPTLRDVVQNTCPLHENVKRCIKALNRFFKKNKCKDLMIPSSTIDLALMMICNPNPNDPQVNRCPLNWSPNCTKRKCDNCGGGDWFETIKQSILSKGLEEKVIMYSHWIQDKQEGKIKQILRQEKCSIVDFLDNVLYSALITNFFAEHLRKAWCQWQITKYPIKVMSHSPNDVAIRSREDFQEDIKFLCLSETVATHRGIGVVTMVCFPSVLEVFRTDGSMDMYGYIILSDTKSKGYNTVKHFEELSINYVRNLGYNVVRFDRITDGCSSQFWCYGTSANIEVMPDTMSIPLVNFHRLERYEGKSLSDALGSLLKRKMRSCALGNRVFGSRDDFMQDILDEIDDNTDLDDLVFESLAQAFQWIKNCMIKPEGNFSEHFKNIELLWVGAEDIPQNWVVESEVKKVKNHKSFNLATSVSGKGVFMRDNSCVCESCLQGNVFNCAEIKNGTYVHFSLEKKRIASKPIGEPQSDSEEEEEYPMDYNSEVDDSSSDSENSENDDEEESNSPPLLIDTISINQWVLYKWQENKYYVGIVSDITCKEGIYHITLNLMKRYLSRERQLVFVMPELPHIVVVDDVEESKCMYNLPTPGTCRRGTTFIFATKLFHIPLDFVQ